MKNKNYPVTVSFVADHPKAVSRLFLKLKPHKGAFIGVTILETAFVWDNIGELYEDLQMGEKLFLRADEESKLAMPPLSVCREDNTFLGKLPYSQSVVPNLLKSRGISVWAYMEAKSFNGGMPSFAVSIYCEKY